MRAADAHLSRAGTRDEIWATDPATLRDVVLDREAMQARLEDCTALERVWILSLLGREEEALTEGLALLAASRDRLRPLLVLAQTYQRRYQWHHAARLHEEALRLARTPGTEALVRHQIGRRLFDEARYRDAAAEFEWAHDLYRTSGRDRLAGLSRRCMNRTREVQGQTHNLDGLAQAVGRSGAADL
jgi:tetratricopeptide (TPR) repeat protein